MKKDKATNRYERLIEAVFRKYYRPGEQQFIFQRADIEEAAQEMGVALPKNLGDILYSFRYRTQLPQSIAQQAPAGFSWVIRPAGRGRYRFELSEPISILPSPILAGTKIPNATPGVIEKYALSDEQALLAKIRYNRLIDMFTGLVCYSLQSHLRTTVHSLGQVETDEIYVGIDKRGAHFVIPIQAKGKHERIGIVQVEQDFALCTTKFPTLICRPVAAQFMVDGAIALFEFEQGEDGIRVSAEKHYHLVPPDSLLPDDLAKYRLRSD